MTEGDVDCQLRGYDVENRHCGQRFLLVRNLGSAAALALVEIPVCTGMTRGDVDCQSARE